MRVYYNGVRNKGKICVEVPIDYSQKETMKQLGQILLSQINTKDWLVQGLGLNRVLEDEEMLPAQMALETLFNIKNKKMNVSMESGPGEKDNIFLDKEEVIEYFADFAVFYMEVTICPANKEEQILEISTEADACYVFVCVPEKRKQYAREIIKNIGVLELSYIEIGSYRYNWKDSNWAQLFLEYPEIKDFIEAKLLKMQNDGWTKGNEYTRTNQLSRKARLFYTFYLENGKQIESLILEFQYDSLCRVAKIKLVNAG